MHGEVTFDHLDRLIDAYAAASLYVDNLRELETRIGRAMADLLRYPGTFYDLTAMLSTRTVSRELVTRRIAWAAQHILGKRAWCVGNKLLVKFPGQEGAWASPLLDQLRTLGFVSASEQSSDDGDNGGAGSDRSHEESPFEVPALDKIDALICNAGSDEVWVVRGNAYSTAQRLSPELWVNSDRDSLFGIDDRFMTRLCASGSSIRTLLAARDLIQAAHPQLKVRACYLVINDPGCTWHFQAHDLTSARPEVSREARVKLDSFPVLATHRDFAGHFAKEGLGFAPIPDWGCDDPITALPADRPVRSLLLLQDLWSRQINRPKRLVAVRGEDLADAVIRTGAVAMGRDLWRHDLEDCLERGGFVRRLPDRPGRFAITPRGVARVLLLRRKLGAGPDLTAAQVMSHVTHQSRLWAAAPVA